MSSIINDALVILSDLELNLSSLTAKLNSEDRHKLAVSIEEVVSKLGSTERLTEREFSELANELIEVINSSEAVRETLSADEEIASAQERAAQLASFDRKKPTSEGSPEQQSASTNETEQFEFLANQIINRCQIIRKRLDQSTHFERWR